MYTLYEDRINWILREISKGFKINPLNITIFFIIIITFLLIFLFLTKRADSLLKQKLENIFNKKFQKSVKRLKLSTNEIELLKTLSKYVTGTSNKYLLLENEHIFQSTVKKLLEKEPYRTKEISSLRVKLGFKKHSFDSVPHSTAELVDNTIIKLISKNGSKATFGELAKITPAYLVLNIRDEINPIKKGKMYIAQFQYHSGIFYFTTQCIGTRGFQVFISHSEDIKRTQRRNYYRKNINIPISICTETNGKSFYSYTTNLGGGGASIKGSPEFIQIGDVVTCNIDLPGNYKITSRAKVIEISENKNMIRVYFLDLKESDRDQIIKCLFER